MTDRTREDVVMIRWYITRALVWFAFKIAPRGPARDLCISALNNAGVQMMLLVAQNRAVDKRIHHD